MSGYLEAYGEAGERHARRIRIVKISSIVLGCLLVAGLILYGIFRNYREEQQAKTFIELLRARNYQAAYRLWCTDANPCPAYGFKKFMEDWGPESPHADATSAQLGSSQTCGSGVMIRVDYGKKAEPVPLWIERDTKLVGFAPWDECPGRHLRIGAWWRSLFNKS
jgi:hypothetical protein